jgi:para-nitrobenzyl esterase
MVMPAAQGLFHRAIAESGAGVSVISPDSALKVSTRLAEILGVDVTREAIAEVPMARLLEAVAKLTGEVGASPRRKKWGDVAQNLMAFEPVVDGTVLPGIPEDLMIRGAAQGIELLIGTNSGEARLFFVPSGAMSKMSAIVPHLFAWVYGARRLGSVRTYRRARPGATHGEVAADILTDGFYRIPALRLAERHPHAHVYEFAWTSGAYEGRLGACHALELPFVFDTLDDDANAALLGREAPAALATAMHGAWVDFARTGDPGWPLYTPSERVSQRFDSDIELTFDDRRAERLVWRQS